MTALAQTVYFWLVVTVMIVRVGTASGVLRAGRADIVVSVLDVVTYSDEV